MTAQAGDDGVGLPVPERRHRAQALAPPAAAAQPHQLGVHESLVEEHEPRGLLLHAGLTVCRPDPALIANGGACALRRQQLFFDL
jgi:hypothetical protein